MRYSRRHVGISYRISLSSVVEFVLRGGVLKDASVFRNSCIRLSDGRLDTRSQQNGLRAGDFICGTLSLAITTPSEQSDGSYGPRSAWCRSSKDLRSERLTGTQRRQLKDV